MSIYEFGPLNLEPGPGQQWVAVKVKHKEHGRAPRRPLSAHTLHGCSPPTSWGADKLYGHIRPPRENRTWFLGFCRYLCSLYLPTTKIAIISNNFGLHLSGQEAGSVPGLRRTTSRSPMLRQCLTVEPHPDNRPATSTGWH